jgi:tetratricopeptide (TPR) repeat protein
MVPATPILLSPSFAYTEKLHCAVSQSAAVMFLEVGGKLLEQGQHSAAMEMFDSSFRAINSPPSEFTNELNWGNQQIVHNTNTSISPPVDTYHEDECDVGPRPFMKALICGEEAPVEVLQLAICYNKALVHHARNNFAAALQIYNVIIGTITTALVNNSPSVEKLHIAMRAYNNMGQISYNEQAEDAALMQFKTAVIFASRIQDLSSDHVLNYATVLSNWCRVQWMIGSVTNDVCTALEEVLRARFSVLGWDHSDVASAHYNLGMAEYSRGNNTKALSHLMQYLAVSSHQLKAGKPQELDPIPALVFVLLIKNENKEDKTSQDLVWGLRALQEKRHELGTSDAEVASVLNFIGTLLFHQKELDHALLFFREELRLEEELIQQGEDVCVSVTCNNIGRILQELGRFHQAIHYYRRSLRHTFGDVAMEQDTKGKAAVSSSIFDHDDYDLPEATMNLYSTVWYNLGLIHDKMGAYPDAIRAFQMSLKLRRAMLGRNHPDVACLLYNIGVLQMEQQTLNDATGSFREALRIRRVAATGQLNDRHVVKTLQKLSSLHKSKGNIKGALEACGEVVDILKVSVDFDEATRRKFTGTTLRDIAELYHAQGDLNLALQTAIESVSSLRRGQDIDMGMESTAILEQLNNVEQETATLLLIGSLQHEQCDPLAAHATFADAAVLIRNSIMSHGASDAENFCSSLLPLFEVSSKLAYAHCAPEA